MGRASRKRVDVKQIVPGCQLELSAPLFLGSKAGVVEAPRGCVGGEQTLQKGDHPAAVRAHNLEQAGRVFGAFSTRAGDAVLLGAIGDVLVVLGSDLLLSEQEIAVFPREHKRSLPEEENPPHFQVSTVFVRRFWTPFKHLPDIVFPDLNQLGIHSRRILFHPETQGQPEGLVGADCRNRLFLPGREAFLDQPAPPPPPPLPPPPPPVAPPPEPAVELIAEPTEATMEERPLAKPPIPWPR